jgi:hypothetical protein
LILASGSLIAAALVRLARVVDRVRSLAATTPVGPATLTELTAHERRARRALAAITLYFVAVGLFVLSGIAIALDHLAAGGLTWLPVSLTLAGMVSIVAGAGYMTAETRDSAALIAVDIARIRQTSRAAEGR